MELALVADLTEEDEAAALIQEGAESLLEALRLDGSNEPAPADGSEPKAGQGMYRARVDLTGDKVRVRLEPRARATADAEPAVGAGEARAEAPDEKELDEAAALIQAGAELLLEPEPAEEAEDWEVHLRLLCIETPAQPAPPAPRATAVAAAPPPPITGDASPLDASPQAVAPPEVRVRLVPTAATTAAAVPAAAIAATPAAATVGTPSQQHRHTSFKEPCDDSAPHEALLDASEMPPAASSGPASLPVASPDTIDGWTIAPNSPPAAVASEPYLDRVWNGRSYQQPIRVAPPSSKRAPANPPSSAPVVMPAARLASPPPPPRRGPPKGSTAYTRMEQIYKFQPQAGGGADHAGPAGGGGSTGAEAVQGGVHGHAPVHVAGRTGGRAAAASPAAHHSKGFAAAAAGRQEPTLMQLVRGQPHMSVSAALREVTQLQRQSAHEHRLYSAHVRQLQLQAGRPARAAPERPAFWLGAASNAELSAGRRAKTPSQAVKGMAGGARQLRAAREAPTLHVGAAPTKSTACGTRGCGGGGGGGGGAPSASGTVRPSSPGQAACQRAAPSHRSAPMLRLDASGSARPTSAPPRPPPPLPPEDSGGNAGSVLTRSSGPAGIAAG